MFSARVLRSLLKSQPIRAAISPSSSSSARFIISVQSFATSACYTQQLQVSVLLADSSYGVVSPARPSYTICRQIHSGAVNPVLKENGDDSNGVVAAQQAVQAAEKHPDETLSTYWGITRKPVYRKDGSLWPWRSFMPWDTYTADTNVDLTRHHKMDTLTDKAAYWTVKTLRWPTDLFFQKRYGCRAMMLETVAAVPGVVAGMILHLRSLRRFEHSGGWIKALLEEAENERMHLMTFMEVSDPRWYERALVMAVQVVFFNAYLGLYVMNPRLAHRIVGYLEEEAIHSYTQYLHEIDIGKIENVPAPLIAIDYWRLPANARIRDVVEVVRADEAHHRDVNHFAADIYEAGKPLKDLPAPLGYH